MTSLKVTQFEKKKGGGCNSLVNVFLYMLAHGLESF